MNTRYKHFKLAAILLAGISATTLPGTASAVWTFNGLGTLGGTQSYVTGINATGQVTGYSSTGVGANQEAFITGDNAVLA